MTKKNSFPAFNRIFKSLPFSLHGKKKYDFILNQIIKLNKFHEKKSNIFKKISKNLNFSKSKKLKDQVFIPISLFKLKDLVSCKKKDIFKVVKSSGTTSNLRSKIYLDKENLKNQSNALTIIFKNFFGQKRLSMLIIDKDPKNLIKEDGFSAKTSAILGFSLFGKNHTYLLSQSGKIQIKVLKNFLSSLGEDEEFLIFGFTSYIYKYLLNNKFPKFLIKKFNNGIILHGGGWKKLKNIKISEKNFKQILKSTLGIKRIINYYGLVEQTGSIFFECEECNSFVVSNFSEIIIRDQHFQDISSSNRWGIVQLISILPTSYPGHNILTEDIGKIIKERSNNCKYKQIKHFQILKRIEKSEIRGCSDI